MANEIIVGASIFPVRLAGAFLQAFGNSEVAQPLLGSPKILSVNELWHGLRERYKHLYFSSWPSARAVVLLYVRCAEAIATTVVIRAATENFILKVCWLFGLGGYAAGNVIDSGTETKTWVFGGFIYWFTINYHEAPSTPSLMHSSLSTTFQQTQDCNSALDCLVSSHCSRAIPWIAAWSSRANRPCGNSPWTASLIRNSKRMNPSFLHKNGGLSILGSCSRRRQGARPIRLISSLAYGSAEGFH